MGQLQLAWLSILYPVTPLSPVRTLPEFYVDNALIPIRKATLLQFWDTEWYVMVNLQ